MKNLLLVGLLFNSILLTGQIHLIGLDAGLNLTNFVTNQPINFDRKFKPGFSAGLDYTYLSKGHFFFGTGIVYQQRGYSYEIFPTDPQGNFKNSINLRANFHYLGLPVKIGYKTGEDFIMFFNVGLVPAIILNANRSVKEFEFNGVKYPKNRIDATKNVKTFDIACLLEAGGIFKLSNQYKLTISIQYQNSIETNYFKNKNSNLITHYGFTTNFGVRYILNHKL